MNLKIKNEGILNLIIVILVSLGILAPIASNQFMPNITDFVSHSGLIVQAKKALFTGDFPIRVAPWQHHGYQYPEFQFYSPFPYTIAAIVYGVFLSFNVYFALKTMYFFILIFAGVYAYRLGSLISKSKEIGILTAVSYIVAPYFLINILARSAFTEAFAQGLIPFCLFHTFKFFNEEITVKRFLLVSLSWFMLLTSHLITFINFSLFISIWVLGTWLLKVESFKKIMLYGFSYLYAIILASWFIFPILLHHHQLNINHDVTSIFESNWLTPLSELFSFQAVSMMPLPGNGFLNSEIYPSLGWLSIISFVGLWYSLSTKSQIELTINRKLVFLLMGLFFLATIMTWSPINFWKVLPQFLKVSQFSYRFLMHTSWLGSLLFAIFLSIYFKEKNIFFVLIGVLLILNLSGSWIHTLVSKDLKPSSIATNPDIGYGAFDYLYDIKNVEVKFTNTQLPLTYNDGWLITNKSITLNNEFLKNNSNITLDLQGINFLKQSTVLKIIFNNKILNKINIPKGKFNIQIPIQLSNLDTKNLNQMKLITSRFISPSENGVKSRKLSLKIDSIKFINAKNIYNAISAEEMNEHCYLKKINHQSICEINIPKNVSVVQLPLLYYPNMLLIEVDGHSIGQSYFSSTCNQYQCVTMNIKPGQHTFLFKFRGLSWANKLSLASWLIFLFVLSKGLFTKRNKNGFLDQKLIKGFMNAFYKEKCRV